MVYRQGRLCINPSAFNPSGAGGIELFKSALSSTLTVKRRSGGKTGNGRQGQEGKSMKLTCIGRTLEIVIDHLTLCTEISNTVEYIVSLIYKI